MKYQTYPAYKLPVFLSIGEYTSQTMISLTGIARLLAEVAE
jgi:hypothetical protein